MENMKIIRSVDKEGISKAIKDEVKEQKGRILDMHHGTFGASLLGKMLSGLTGKYVICACDGIICAGENFSASASFN